MTDLFWPGDHRADDLLTASALVADVERVEAAWLDALVACGIAPPGAAGTLVGLVGPDDLVRLTDESESGGNPVIPVLALLRQRSSAQTARWLHRGLTSQDVMDTALVLGLRDVVARVRAELLDQVEALSALATQHRGTLMVARTLTQHAVPTTFGVVASGWLTGVLDALEDVARVDGCWAVQVGGAGGTMAAPTLLADSAEGAVALVADVAERLGLAARPPWHTSRAPITRVADALVQCCDAWGHLAADVLLLGRPEVAEVHEGRAPGRGGSSSMPQKQNPVLSVLTRRAALVAPQLGATVHVAAASAVDQRPDGAWHAEWAPVRDLARRAVVAASQTTEVVRGLVVDVHRMRATLDRSVAEVMAEQHAMAAFAGRDGLDDPSTYVGAADLLVDAACDRAALALRATA